MLNLKGKLKSLLNNRSNSIKDSIGDSAGALGISVLRKAVEQGALILESRGESIALA